MNIVEVEEERKALVEVKEEKFLHALFKAQKKKRDEGVEDVNFYSS